MSHQASQLFQRADRPHPGRTDLATYPLVVDVQARYADMDVNGHINNLALESLHEDVRARMNRAVLPGVYQAGQQRLRLVSAQNVVHFLAEAVWPTTFHAAVGVGSVGTSSFVASSAVFSADECVSLCDTVLVAVGDDGPHPLPKDARDELRHLMLRPT